MPPSPPPADDSDELDEEDVLADEDVLVADGVPVPVVIGPSRRLGFSLLDICVCCNRVNGCCGRSCVQGEPEAAMTATVEAGAEAEEAGAEAEATTTALSSSLCTTADDDEDDEAVKGCWCGC